MSTKCFVLMPFRQPFNDYYQNVIYPSIVLAEMKPIRADEIYSTHSLIADIFREIGEATALVADVTGKNPNVNYELGIAHAFEKPVIIISQSRDDIPFDYQHYRSTLYNVNEANWEQKLKNYITKTLIGIKQERKGIIDFLGRWVGWYKEPDEDDWRPTAHEIQQNGNLINAIAYGEENHSISICSYLDEQTLGKKRLIWTYGSKTTKRIGGLPDHTGTHIAEFTIENGGMKHMDGWFYNDRKQKTGCIGAVGYFRCVWVSNEIKNDRAFDKDYWPIKKPNNRIKR